MSVFRKIDLACPACSQSVSFDAAHSINADRRPDLRTEVLNETLQSTECPHCGKSFRLAPDINYLDIGRGQWLAAHPIEKLGNWKALEDRDRGLFDKAYGRAAPSSARAIGDRLTARITFGWAGMREKLVLSEVGLDEVTVELVKIALIRGLDDSPLEQDTELRLVDADEEVLHFVWFRVPTEEFVEGLKVPRALYDEVAADVDGWAAIREQFDGALYVDMNRLLIPGEPEAASA